jgi:hypothetical protein
MKKRGRPASGGPIVSVDIDGVGIAWCDGVFAGSPELVKEAQWIAYIGSSVALVRGGVKSQANSETPVGAAASMIGISPGRAKIVEAPKEVLVLLKPRKNPERTIGSIVISSKSN